MAGYFGGDKAKSAEMASLFAAAYPENPDAAPAADGVVLKSEGAERSEEEWLAGPKAAHEPAHSEPRARTHFKDAQTR